MRKVELSHIIYGDKRPNLDSVVKELKSGEMIFEMKFQLQERDNYPKTGGRALPDKLEEIVSGPKAETK